MADEMPREMVQSIVILLMATRSQRTEAFDVRPLTDKLKNEQMRRSKVVLDKQKIEEANEDSRTCPKLPVPIRVEHDDQITRSKGKMNKKSKKQLQNDKLTEQIKHQEEEKINQIVIPVSKATQDIFNKASLRERYAGLLPLESRLQLGYDHRRLLKVHKLIDQTLDFFLSQRSIKTIFFQDLRKNLKQSVNAVIDLTQIQQILFLDQTLYSISWEININIRKYDILIRIQKIKSFDERQAQTKRRLIQFLLAHQAQYIASGKCQKKDPFQWAIGFDPALISIPMKPLPPHPYQKNAILSSMTDAQVKAVQNPVLQSALKQQKEKSEANRSLTSGDVANMIFAKKSVQEIKNKIYEAVKEREEEQKKMAIEMAPSEVKLDKKTVKRICEEILLIYMAKGVSNMFRVTLLDMLFRKTQIHPDELSSSLSILLKLNNGFVKEVFTSNKMAVIQINKTKTNQTKEAVDQL